MGGIAPRQVMCALLLAQLVDPDKTNLIVHGIRFGDAPAADGAKQIHNYLFSRVVDRTRDTPEATLYRVCNGIVAKFEDTPITKLPADPAGLGRLRSMAKAKLTPILVELFGNTPRGFYSPRSVGALTDSVAAK